MNYRRLALCALLIAIFGIQSTVYALVSVADDFLRATSFMETAITYTELIDIYSGSAYEAVYDNAENNDIDWESMSEYERTTHSLMHLYPSTIILGPLAKTIDKDTFFRFLEVINAKLDHLERGHEVKDALRAVWQWHWDNFEIYEVYINPFTGDETSTKEAVSPTPDIKPTAKPSAQIDINLSTDSSKVPVPTIVILIVLVVAMFVLGVYLDYHRRRKPKFVAPPRGVGSADSGEETPKSAASGHSKPKNKDDK